MSNISIEILSMSDEQVLSEFEALAGILEPSLANVSWRLFENVGAVNSPLADVRSHSEMRQVLESAGSLLAWLQVSLTIQQNVGASFDLTRRPDGTGTISIQIPPQVDAKASLRTTIQLACKQRFFAYTRSVGFAQLSPAMGEFYDRREATLVRLESLHSKILYETDEYRRSLETQVEQRRAQMEADFDGRTRDLQAKFDERVQALTQRELALTDREKSLEMADNTHARRKLRQDLKQELQNRHTSFTLTRGTVIKRRPVALACYLLMLVTLTAAVFSGWLTTQALPSGVFAWLPSLRLGLSVAAFAGAVVFYIRWEDRWSQIHADEEFQLKRLDLDIDRASWLVEMMLEWRGAAGIELPQAFLDRLANGLFNEWQGRPAATHPAEDAIASILSSPAAVKLNFPGGEVSLDRKAMKEARQG
jgi:hypothetical protein